ncbi:hypothetical protein D3C71_1580970 [compost metagenome]
MECHGDDSAAFIPINGALNDALALLVDHVCTLAAYGAELISVEDSILACKLL